MAVDKKHREGDRVNYIRKGGDIPEQVQWRWTSFDQAHSLNLSLSPVSLWDKSRSTTSSITNSGGESTFI